MSTSKAETSVLVVAGEPSGDLHMAGVLAEFHRQFPDLPVNWVGSGGSRMRSQGVEILADVEDLAAIGPWAALGNLKNYLGLYRRLLAEARTRTPELAVLVDFPEFNLRLARRLKALDVKVCYFIGPQVWAWRTSRIGMIQKYVDRMLVIFPFEEEFYRSRGVDAAYVGNPGISLRQFKAPAETQSGLNVGEEALVALMPGSRKKEIREILPVQLEAAVELQKLVPCRFRVIQTESRSGFRLESLVSEWLKRHQASLKIEVCTGRTAELLPEADCAIIKSGTSTLEAMILEVPFVMVYRMAGLSYRLLRPWVKIDTFCLANWVAGERVVPEFVQAQARGAEIARCLSEWLLEPVKLQKMKQKLQKASLKLGTKEAYSNCAVEIARFLKDG